VIAWTAAILVFVFISWCDHQEHGGNAWGNVQQRRMAGISACAAGMDNSGLHSASRDLCGRMALFSPSGVAFGGLRRRMFVSLVTAFVCLSCATGLFCEKAAANIFSILYRTTRGAAFRWKGRCERTGVRLYYGRRAGKEEKNLLCAALGRSLSVCGLAAAAELSGRLTPCLYLLGGHFAL